MGSAGVPMSAHACQVEEFSQRTSEPSRGGQNAAKLISRLGQHGDSCSADRQCRCMTKRCAKRRLALPKQPARTPPASPRLSGKRREPPASASSPPGEPKAKQHAPGQEQKPAAVPTSSMEPDTPLLPPPKIGTAWMHRPETTRSGDVAMHNVATASVALAAEKAHEHQNRSDCA